MATTAAEVLIDTIYDWGFVANSLPASALTFAFKL